MTVYIRQTTDNKVSELLVRCHRLEEGSKIQKHVTNIANSIGKHNYVYLGTFNVIFRVPCQFLKLTQVSRYIICFEDLIVSY